MEEPRAESHQEDVISGSVSGEIIEGEAGTESIFYVVEDPEDPDPFIAGHVPS